MIIAIAKLSLQPSATARWRGGTKNVGYIDLSSIKKSFENCKSAVLAVKRLAGDNIQPLFASERP